MQKLMKSEIIYFADQKNFPYGNKSKYKLKKIINETIKKLDKKFEPDMIVIASNTPSILFSNYINNSKIIGVLPPIKEASILSKSSNIGILATNTTIKSKALSDYIKKTTTKNVKIFKINASRLIQLVEDGKFLTNKKYCKKIIKKELRPIILKHNIDVITLSSTHLPFLLLMLQEEFPEIIFLDPADNVAKEIKKLISDKPKYNKLKIYTSKNPEIFQKHLKMLGIRNKINFLP